MLNAEWWVGVVLLSLGGGEESGELSGELDYSIVCLHIWRERERENLMTDKSVTTLLTELSGIWETLSAFQYNVSNFSSEFQMTLFLASCAIFLHEAASTKLVHRHTVC